MPRRETERPTPSGESESLGQGAASFSLLVESVKDYAIFLLDARGHVVTWNLGAERIKAYRASEIIGQHFSRFYPEEDVKSGKPDRELETATRDGRIEDEGWRIRKDGTRFWANVVITALRGRDQELLGFAKVTRDLTERRRAEEERIRLASEAAASASAERFIRLATRLNVVAGAVAGARTPEHVAKVLVEQGAESLDATMGVLVRIRDDRLELVATHGVEKTVADAWRVIPKDLSTPIGAACLTGQAQWVETPADLEREYPEPRDRAPRGSSWVALPLLLEDRPVGAIGFRFDGPRPFRPEERALVQTMATHGAQALDRADAYAREVAARGRVEALRDLSEGLSAALSVEEVARTVVDHGSRLAKADTCTLYRLDDATGDLVLAGERGCNPAVLPLIQRIGEASLNPVYRTISTGKSFWVETARAYHELYPSLADLPSEGARASAFWSVPLIAESRAIGLIGMGYFEEHEFTPEQRNFFETFARQSGEALLRAMRLDAERAARTVAENLRAWLSTTLRSIGDAVIATDLRGAITIMNRHAEALTGWREAEAVARPLGEVFRVVEAATRAAVRDPVDEILESGAPTGIANGKVLIARDGSETPIDDSAAPIRGESGEIAGVVIVFRDVTEKKRDEWRRAFLADATAALTQSLDYEATLARVAHLAVPVLADWCAVDILQDGQRHAKRLATAHRDPAKVQLATELQAKYPANPDAPSGVPHVLRTGLAEHYPDIPDELLVAGAVDDEHLRWTRELGLRSAMVLPLVARGRTLGAMTFVFAESGRRYTEADVHFAEELARRCAVAIDNARLFISEQRARQNADVASRAKDEFLAMVSHELRTPLNAILGWAKMMSSPAFDEGRRARAVETIERNAAAMAQLIEDLLDMSRIISGKMRLDVQRMEIAPVVDAALESVRPVADAKEIRITSLFDTSLPEVVGDPTRIQQIVWNLLSNAVKFTPKGGRIEVVLDRSDSWAAISVADTGRGIAGRFLPHVFDAFRQEDASSTRSRGGLGLGLAITRQLVELHGGRIEAQSEGEGRGATFRVLLPISAVARSSSKLPSASPEPPTAPPRRPELEGLRVLVVDDEKDARQLVQAVLEDCGCRVTLAAGVDAAMDAFAQEIPDVVVSDIGMPERDGYDLIRQIRALPRPKGGDVPAAALTAYARAEDRLKMLAAGYSMHLAKPIDPQELVVMVASLTRFAVRSRP